MGLDSLIDEIKSRLDIVDVVSSYVPLKRIGRNFVGLCPFHIEKTPSFTVSPEKQIFYCFGCGTGGDVIKFLQLIEGVDFAEALEKAAEIAGVSVERSPDVEKARKKTHRLKAIQAHLARAFSSFLKGDAGSCAREHLKSRGIKPLWWEVFRLGYLPDGVDLAASLLKRGYTVDELLETGSFYLRGRTPVCRFTGRVIIPITDFSGDVVAFGGRIIGQGEPKYLNSPETSIFKKGRILFAYPQAREKIRSAGRAILVEGYMDAIRMHAEGFQETVASLGTALTREQARRLTSLTRNIYILYDGDEAGRRASFKAARVFYALGVEPRVVLLEEGMDPDDALRERGRDYLESLIERAKSPVDILLDRKESGSMSLKRIVDDISELLGECEDVVVLDSVLSYVAQKTGLPFEDLRLRFRKKGGFRREKITIDRKQNGWERKILLAFIGYPQFWERWRSRIKVQMFRDGAVARVIEKMLSCASVDQLPSVLDTDELPLVAEALFGDPVVTPEEVEPILERMCLRWELEDLKNRVALLKREGREHEYRELLEVYMRKLREIKSAGGGSA